MTIETSDIPPSVGILGQGLLQQTPQGLSIPRSEAPSDSCFTERPEGSLLLWFKGLEGDLPWSLDIQQVDPSVLSKSR